MIDVIFNQKYCEPIKLNIFRQKIKTNPKVKKYTAKLHSLILKYFESFFKLEIWKKKLRQINKNIISKKVNKSK